MRRVILDSSFVVALVDRNDELAAPAHRLHEQLVAEGAEYIYLDCVLNEVLTVLGRRCARSRQAAPFRDLVRQLHLMVRLDRVRWLSARLPDLYDQVLGILLEHQGRLSFHDALIVVGAPLLRVEEIASFDRDFDRVPGLRRLSVPVRS